jgi:hypothetical protein
MKSSFLAPKGETGLRSAVPVGDGQEAKVDRKEKEYTAAVD